MDAACTAKRGMAVLPEARLAGSGDSCREWGNVKAPGNFSGVYLKIVFCQMCVTGFGMFRQVCVCAASANL